MPNLGLTFSNLTRLTIPGFLLFAPISILAYPVSMLVVNPKTSILTLLIGGFVITTATFPFYFLLTSISKLVAPKGKVLISFKFLAVISATGAIRGLFFYQTGKYLELIQPSTFTSRILASMFTTIFWLGVSNYLVNRSRRFKDEYQSTLNQFLISQVNSETTRLNPGVEILELQKFHDQLNISLITFLQSQKSHSFLQLSERLTFHINEQLRPLSRRIWLRSLSEYPVINVKILLRDSLRTLDFSKPSFMVVMSILALLNNLFLRNPFESFWRTSTYIVISGIGIWLFQFVLENRDGVWVNYLFLISMGTLPIYGSEVLVALFDFKQNFFAASLITPVPIAVIIVLSLLKLTQKDRRFLLNLLEQKEGEIFKQTTQGLDAEKRQLASYLHNSFQSELLSLSSQLAAAAVSKDKDQTASILQRVSAVAQRSLTDDLSRMNQEPLERLNEVIESWKNLLQIDLQVPQEILIQKLNSHVFLQTVEEVSSNAYRHDKATKVTITSEPGEIGTRIFFQSNGVQPISKSKGMGSNWLNQVSLKPWSIEKNDAGTLITLEL